MTEPFNHVKRTLSTAADSALCSIRPRGRRVVVSVGHDSALCSIRLTLLQSYLLVHFYEKQRVGAPELAMAVRHGLITPSEYVRYTSFVLPHLRTILREFYGIERFEKTRDRWGRICDSEQRWLRWRKKYRCAVLAISAAKKRLAAKGLISNRWLFTVTEKGCAVAESLKTKEGQ